MRRFDRWIVHRLGPELRRTPDPLVVDLGFGASPVTTLELAQRLQRGAGRPVDVLGMELDPARVAQARPLARAHVDFVVGGFEIPGPRRPVLIRAANVLRQYDENDVPGAWATMTRRLAPDGILVEGTCDELGRRGSWVTVRADPACAADDRPTDAGRLRPPDRGDAGSAPAGAPVPESWTMSVDLRRVVRPSEVAERLPKALIHRNVPGQPIHSLLRDLDRAWERAAPHGVFGPRQRWLAAVAALRADGWPIRDGPSRWRLGELTLPWSSVAPAASPRP